MRTNKQKILSRAEGTITIDIPPIQLPTPVKAARWCVTNPVMRALFFIVIGIGIGHGWHSTLPKVSPAPVITVTETLADFVARESQGLTADERQNLIAVTETILREHFDTPSEIREAFRYERRKALSGRAGIDSPAFNAFNEKWEKELGGRSQEFEESVEGMRRVYESLLRGLQSQSPNSSLLTSDSYSGDVPVSPNVLGGMVDESVETPLPVRRLPSLQRRK